MADSKGFLECPACGKQMTKIYMEEAGVNIDICLDGCGGIYFDNRELEKFDESPKRIDEILSAIEARHFEPVSSEEVRICPVCEVAMAKMGAANGEVEIDVCHTCGGKFLDNGELQRIREIGEKTTSKAEEILTAMYEAEMSSLTESPRIVFAGSEKRRGFFEDFARRYFL